MTKQRWIWNFIASSLSESSIHLSDEDSVDLIEDYILLRTNHDNIYESRDRVTSQLDHTSVSQYSVCQGHVNLYEGRATCYNYVHAPALIYCDKFDGRQTSSSDMGHAGYLRDEQTDGRTVRWNWIGMYTWFGAIDLGQNEKRQSWLEQWQEGHNTLAAGASFSYPWCIPPSCTDRQTDRRYWTQRKTLKLTIRWPPAFISSIRVVWSTFCHIYSSFIRQVNYRLIIISRIMIINRIKCRYICSTFCCHALSYLGVSSLFW